MSTNLCDICGKLVDDELETSLKGGYFINAQCGKSGEPITIRGHKKCLDNVDNKIVTPNRMMARGMPLESAKAFGQMMSEVRG